jgi:hypothetical protein
MRSLEDKEFLVSRFTDTVYVKEFLQPEEILYLIDLFDKSDAKIYKNTGPVTCNSIKKDPILSVIAQRFILLHFFT